MAKVEIEDRAFQDPALVSASSKHHVAKAVILGYAAVLWRMSQQAGAECADRDTILGWLDTDRFAKPKTAFEWLLSSGHLIPVPEQNFFKIHGNSDRIHKIATRIENAKAAVRARERKRSPIDSISDRSSTAHPDSKTVRQDDRMTVKHTARARVDLFLEDTPKLADWFAQALKVVNPEARIPLDLGPWVYQLQSLAEESGVDVRRIGAVARWALEDDFWVGVITSPGKLAEKWESVTAQARRPRPLEGWEKFEGRR